MSDGLLGPIEIRQLAAHLELRPTKTLGQNFVHDANTVRRIVDTSGIGPSDHVLEIGPGLGSLTLALVQQAAAVTAVEIDPRLADLLARTVRDRVGAAASPLRIVCADALTVGYDDIHPEADRIWPDPPTAVVANLPYNVSVPVILHLLAELPSVRTMLVMVQAEVADRLVAGPGSRTYGGPSAKLAWYGTARRAGAVSRGIFWPVPGVDSALVAFDRHREPAPAELRAATFAVIDAAFAQRRKTLRAALARWAGNAARAEALCRAAGVDPGARGETLPVQAFRALADAQRHAAGHQNQPTLRGQ